jgi:hypothetical protein
MMMVMMVMVVVMMVMMVLVVVMMTATMTKGEGMRTHKIDEMLSHHHDCG